METVSISRANHKLDLLVTPCCINLVQAPDLIWVVKHHLSNQADREVVCVRGLCEADLSKIFHEGGQDWKAHWKDNGIELVEQLDDLGLEP